MIFIGIDAGGTHARCAAVDDAGRIVGVRRSEGANLHRHGLDGTARRLLDLVRLAVQDSLLDGPIHAAVCVAGLDTQEAEAALGHALNAGAPKVHWQVTNDAVAAWKGAFPASRSGVVAISGTGSVALARNGVRQARAGGWGAVLGDYGSGYDLGRKALIAVLRHHDTLGPATSLEAALLGLFGLARTDALIDHAHFRMQPDDFANLAPLVLSHAEAGDLVACGIVDAAAGSIVELARGAAAAIFSGDDWPVPFALVGGLSRNPYFRERVWAHSAESGHRLAWRRPRASPLVGALELAWESVIAVGERGSLGQMLTPEVTAAIEEAA